MKERLLFQEPGLRTAEAEVPPEKAALRSTAVLGARRPRSRLRAERLPWRGPDIYTASATAQAGPAHAYEWQRTLVEDTGPLACGQVIGPPEVGKLGFQEVMPAAWTADGVPLWVTNTAMSGHDCCPTDFKLHHGGIHARTLPAP